MSDIRSAEDVAREVLGCERAVVEPGRPTSGVPYCAEHYFGWLSDVDMCPRQENVADLIRTRDAEIRADERVKALRDAAEAIPGWYSVPHATRNWLNDRADRIETGARDE